MTYGAVESMAASTTNHLYKALHLPGHQNVRIAGPLETGINAALLAAQVYTGGASTPANASLRTAALTGSKKLIGKFFPNEAQALALQETKGAARSVINNMQEGIRVDAKNAFSKITDIPFDDIFKEKLI